MVEGSLVLTCFWQRPASRRWMIQRMGIFVKERVYGIFHLVDAWLRTPILKCIPFWENEPRECHRTTTLQWNRIPNNHTPRRVVARA